MGVTRQENLLRLRDLLDNPQPNAPSFHQILRQELSEERDIVNATNNSGKPWAVAEYQLNYTVGLSTYDINVDDFGKCLFVVKATNNPYIPFLPVPFEDLSSQQYGTVWGWFNNTYWQAWSLTETPERMSFYREGVINPQYKVKINPLPQQSAVYTITYLPGFLGNDDPLSSSLQMPEHAELVRLRGATALLPYSRWSEDENANSNKRKELAQGFAYQLERKEDLFKKYIRSINIPRQVTIEDWNAFA